jgi:hypothetical protein
MSCPRSAHSPEAEAETRRADRSIAYSSILRGLAGGIGPTSRPRGSSYACSGIRYSTEMRYAS